MSIICGVTSVIADFNQAYNHHIYQPCLPHVLKAININAPLGKAEDKPLENHWKSVYMQSSTDSYDHQHILTQAMGFDQSITAETLLDPQSEHFPPEVSRVNYYGPPDKELKPYLEDILDDAAETGERLFLTHLTATTHHPWNIPPTSMYQRFFGPVKVPHKKPNEKYLNAIGYVDEWLGDILDVLERKGVNNETLLVFVGDQ